MLSPRACSLQRKIKFIENGCYTEVVGESGFSSNKRSVEVYTVHDNTMPGVMSVRERINSTWKNDLVTLAI